MVNSSSKANYKSYEAQSRLVRAMVAAHPEVKWNYKEIVACFGSDMTEHALNHRFRRLRSQSVIIREGRNQGFDMKQLALEHALPNTQDAVEKKDIAKYFGQSTPDGIQFQFRGIKKDAEAIRKAGRTNGSSSLPVTPSKSTSAQSNGSSRPSTLKRSRATSIKRSSSDEDDSAPDMENWSEQDDTPSKQPRSRGPAQKTGMPSRKAARRASATIADASRQLLSSESPAEVEAETPPSSAALSSVGARTGHRTQSTISRADVGQPLDDDGGDFSSERSAFAGHGRDAFVGSDVDMPSFTRPNGDFDPSEI